MLLRSLRASHGHGSARTFGKKMTAGIVDLIAPTFYRREGSPNPADRIPRVMKDYACSQADAEEIIKTMRMLSFGCFQVVQEAAYSGKSQKEAAEHFFSITFPGLSEATRTEITRHASSLI
jgi:hypothetical protein